MSARRTLAVTSALAVALAAAYLLLPPMGTDLSAQVARADFLAEHGLTPIDLRWYGGVNQFGYSLISPAVMAALGVRLTGAVALVGAAVAFVTLLIRTGVPRPLLGGLVGAVCIADNLVSGRVTYGLGVAFGVAALLALTLPAGDRRGRAVRYAAAAAAAVLASAASPVAGLFVVLAGAALLLTRRVADGLVLVAASGVPLAATALLFSEGGWMNISRTETIHAVVASLAVAALVTPAPVRVGALLSAAGVTLAALVHTPVGLNATRLAIMFSLPVVAATARLPGRAAGAGNGPTAAAL
ncbi:MAG TPA: hypothetical protein VHI50_14595, partial [Micromonosporaceae bacterium]|nr:hypothetical protein [Micromonosporaceae bacterium]